MAERAFSVEGLILIPKRQTLDPTVVRFGGSGGGWFKKFQLHASYKAKKRLNVLLTMIDGNAGT